MPPRRRRRRGRLAAGLGCVGRGPPTPAANEHRSDSSTLLFRQQRRDLAAATATARHDSLALASQPLRGKLYQLLCGRGATLKRLHISQVRMLLQVKLLQRSSSSAFAHPQEQLTWMTECHYYTAIRAFMMTRLHMHAWYAMLYYAMLCYDIIW